MVTEAVSLQGEDWQWEAVIVISRSLAPVFQLLSTWSILSTLARNFAACQLFIACVLLDEGLNMNKIIEVKHLKKNYGDKEVLKDINAVIEKGKVITVIGPWYDPRN